MLIVSAYALTLRVDVVGPGRFFCEQHLEAQVGTSYHPGPRQKQRMKGRGHRGITSKFVTESLSHFHMYICIYLFNTHLVRACSHPGSILNTECMILSKDPYKSCFHKVCGLLGKADYRK